MRQGEIRIGAVYGGGRILYQERMVLEIVGPKPSWWQGWWGEPQLKYWVVYLVTKGRRQGQTSEISLKRFANWAKKAVKQEAYKGFVA